MLTGWSPPTTSTPSIVTVTGTARSTAFTWSDFARIVSAISKSVNLLSCVERVPPFGGGESVGCGFVSCDCAACGFLELLGGGLDCLLPPLVGVVADDAQRLTGVVGDEVAPFPPGHVEERLDLGTVVVGDRSGEDGGYVDLRGRGLDLDPGRLAHQPIR